MLEILVEDLANAVVAANDDCKIFKIVQPMVTVSGSVLSNLRRFVVPKKTEPDVDFRS
jgi:hypothetical protein